MGYNCERYFEEGFPTEAGPDATVDSSFIANSSARKLPLSDSIFIRLRDAVRARKNTPRRGDKPRVEEKRR